LQKGETGAGTGHFYISAGVYDFSQRLIIESRQLVDTCESSILRRGEGISDFGKNAILCFLK
jgi:hypothetical protein